MARKTYSEEFRQAVDLYESTPGATLGGIAEDLGITRTALKAWVDRLGTGRTTPPLGQTVPGGDETSAQKIARLEARVAQLEADRTRLTTEKQILKAAAKYFAGETSWWAACSSSSTTDTFEVKRLCEGVDVARSSYYAWRDAVPARAECHKADADLAERVRAVQAQDPAYGAPRVTAELNDGQSADRRVNHQRVARVMRAHSLAGCACAAGSAPRSRPKIPARYPTCSGGTSRPVHRTAATSATSPTCRSPTARTCSWPP